MADRRLSLTALEDRLVPAGTVTEQILVDQIGYRSAAPKVAVFADPINGQNGAVTYVPGANFQVRRVGDDAIVFTGAVTQWKAGQTHAPSGDRAWHGDFSAVTTPGDYYLYDPATDRRSFAFKVADGAYNDLLTTAGRVFYYQRSGFDKVPQFAGNWSHAASHTQERTAQRIVGSTPQGAGTARDVSGGWWDAGDYNKYVPFTTGVLWDLLSAFEWNPAAFSDGWNLPESGNGTPDVLDEVKYELDWLLRMQLGDGSVLNRVGQTSYDVGSGPTADTQPHYYTGPTTWATASFAASTAHAARVFAPYNAAYATTLRQAAERAWGYLNTTPAMNPANGQDGGTLAAAPGSADANMDRRVRTLAAAELYRLTGGAAYKTYFEANYNTAGTSENGHHPITNNRFDPSVATDLNRALVTYALSPGANATVVGQIKTALKNHIDWIILPEFNNKTDPYLGFMWDGHYTWGSNQLKSNWANLLTYAIKLDVSPADAGTYRQVAEEYLHYFHGRNPLAYTYLTNVGAKGANLGADKVPMEAYHGWWPDGSTLYDGATSTYGPAPGYVVGGPNQFFGVSWVAPPYGQPAMKAYRDWNTGWNPSRQANENSWEINEPAIYYQAAYLLLVSQYATAPAVPAPAAPSNLAAAAVSTSQVNLTWADNSSNETGFAVEWSADPNFVSNVSTTPAAANATSISITGLAAATTYHFRVKALNGAVGSAYSNVASATTQQVAPPAAPSNLTAAAVSPSQINLTWADNSATETGFTLQRATDAAFTQNVVTTNLGANATGASATGLAAGTTYHFRVRAANAGGASGFSNAASATTPPAATTGDGLRAVYFDNRDFTGATVTRIDPAVNFNWGNGSPASGIGVDTFSARWTGRVQAVETGTYTFRTYSDDGVRVWVNGQQVINNWTDHAPTYNTGSITLTAGQQYDIRVEYYENGGGAVMQLQWRRPGQTGYAAVPQSQLFST